MRIGSDDHTYEWIDNWTRLPDTFAFEINAYRYVGNTRWHYNDGSSNNHGFGVKFQFALQPVRADSGALRFIPGPHKNPFQDGLAGVPPLGPPGTTRRRRGKR